MAKKKPRCPTCGAIIIAKRKKPICPLCGEVMIQRLIKSTHITGLKRLRKFCESCGYSE